MLVLLTHSSPALRVFSSRSLCAGSARAWRAESAPLMIVKKVLTPYGRLSGLSAAKPLAALCRVGPIEACPDGAGDVVASDAPVGGESTDDV
jgi:hypothetical protein